MLIVSSLLIVSVIIYTFVKDSFETRNFTIHLIDNDVPINLIVNLHNFEKQFIYPYSNTEEFTIKHGMIGDFFAFFKSLGKHYYYVVRQKKNNQIIKQINDQDTIVNQKSNKLSAAVCCILREMPTSNGKAKKAWYICDLKVDKNYQGLHLPLFIARKIGLWHYWQCPRGFAICMNPSQGEPKAASILKKHGPWSVDTQTLNLYTLSATLIEQTKNTLKKILIDQGYMNPHQTLLFKSTSGAKDYEITNTISQQKRSWNLFHIQSGEGTQAPVQHDATYMMCAVEGTELDTNLKKILGTPSSTAQIISHNMKDFDFNYLTSNQI